MSDGWLVAGGLILIVIGMLMGFSLARDAFVRDCSLVGTTIISHKVFTCAEHK